MNRVNGKYPYVQLCAAILALTTAAEAEEHPDDVPSMTAVDAAASADDSEEAPVASEPEPGAPDPDGSEPRGPRKGPGGPGGPPGSAAGGPPAGGPPPMAVGDVRVGLLTRVDLAFDASTFDDPYSATLTGLGILTQVYENVKLATSFLGRYDIREPTGAASILDATIQLEPMPELNLWLGRLVEPVDRSTLSGPWFMSPWYLTGIGYADGQVALPQTGLLGRGNGATVWGMFFGGHLKYYASAFDLVTPGEDPMLVGRINLSLLSPEPGYYNFSSYFGRNILAIGAGAQSKKNGSVNPMTQERADYSEYNADLLFEMNLGGAGVVDIEGAYYKFTGDYERTSSSWLGLVSYVLPWQVAGLQIQPLGRMQQATPAAPGAPTSTLIDGQVSLLLNGFFARFVLGYRRAYAGPVDTSSLFMGVQFMRL